MGNNLGWKSVNTNHDKRNIKPLKKRQDKGITKICSVCGKPIHGGANMCGTCWKFIQGKKNEERRGIL